MKNVMPGIISKVPTQDEIRFLEDKIYEHNAAATKKDDGKLFSKFIYDTEVTTIAGIAGWTWAEVCEITLFWVKEEYRNKGYGRMLLAAAEEEARKEKCKTILVRTYSFQAPAFYQQHGFTIDQVTKDFPAGHSYFCLLKRLKKDEYKDGS